MTYHTHNSEHDRRRRHRDNARTPQRHGVFLMSLALGLGVSVGTGCGTTKHTHTPRTGTEQLVLTSAWDHALSHIDFSPLAGVPVYLDTAHLQAIDQGYVISSIRQAMLSQGVQLQAKADTAQWICEGRVGAYGTDYHDWMVGIPQITIPQTIGLMPAGTIPELPLMKNQNQNGVAKVALYAYDRASGQIRWTSGTSIARANAKNLFVGSFGPIQSGTIYGGTRFPGLETVGLSPNGDKDNDDGHRLPPIPAKDQGPHTFPSPQSQSFLLTPPPATAIPPAPLTPPAPPASAPAPAPASASAVTPAPAPAVTPAPTVPVNPPAILSPAPTPAPASPGQGGDIPATARLMPPR